MYYYYTGSSHELSVRCLHEFVPLVYRMRRYFTRLTSYSLLIIVKSCVVLKWQPNTHSTKA